MGISGLVWPGPHTKCVETVSAAAAPHSGELEKPKQLVDKRALLLAAGLLPPATGTSNSHPVYDAARTVPVTSSFCCTTGLQHDAAVSFPLRNVFAIKIFQQRDGIFPGYAGPVLELRNREPRTFSSG